MGKKQPKRTSEEQKLKKEGYDQVGGRATLTSVKLSNSGETSER